MRVSLNTVKQFIDFDLPPVDELVATINQQLGGVEEVINLGERYKDAKIARVVACERHPNADKLSVCEIDAGTGETIQVVCGAPNVREGLLVVWLPPGAVVPSTADDEPFVLEPKELRGVVSHGMLASARELGIGEDHAGILEIDAAEWKPRNIDIKPGVGFADVYGMDDTIIDIENKMFTHRPDLFGQLGVAREIAGILHQKFTSPNWYSQLEDSGWKLQADNALPLEVFNDAPDKVARFMAVAVRDVSVKPSPLWLQCELVRFGGKPINNIVDVTNYIMLMTAQPVHAYDYDKLRGSKLGARLARAGETVTLLNHKTYKLDVDDIVICDSDGPVGLAGIMGGSDSEVSSETKHIVLEVASFDMYAVRKSSMRHGLFTDALTRFNKGQSPLQTPYVLNLLMKFISDTAGGESASDVFDMRGDMAEPEAVAVTSDFINDRLGMDLSADDMKGLLHNVEIETDDQFNVMSPFWRTDIELPEDVVEEVGRLYGFDKLPRKLPRRSIKPTAKNSARQLAQQVRESLSRSGANEVLTYSFVHEKVIQKSGQAVDQAYRLSNALSPDLQYFRLSVLPSLLDKVHGNIKAGYDEFLLFEIGKSHNKSKLGNDSLPAETTLTDMVYTSKTARDGAAYYRLKRVILRLFDELHVAVSIRPFEPSSDQVDAPFEPARTGQIVTSDGQVLGLVGELKASVRANFKLPDYTAGASIDMDGVLAATQSATQPYRPLSRYPSAERDICFQVDQAIKYQQVLDCVQAELADSELGAQVWPIDIYQSDETATKNVTLRVRLTSQAKTLTSDEVTAALAPVIDRAVSELNATII